MFWLTILLRWMHILGAIGLVGSAFFHWRVVWPGVSDLEDDQRKERFQAMRPHWSKLVMLSILLLIGSGVVNVILMAKAGEFKLVEGWYHSLLAIKILLAVVVFFLMSRITGRSTKAEMMRHNSPKWISLTVVLAVLIVLLAGVMKESHLNPPATDPVGNPTVSTE